MYFNRTVRLLRQVPMCFGEMSMFNKRGVAVVTVMGLLVVSLAPAATVEENWNEFLHYMKIGRLDLAKGYGQSLLEGNPEPTRLLELAEENPVGYAILQKASATVHDAELAQISTKVLDLIEQGRYIRRAQPSIIAEEVRRLSSTSRGKLAAIKRLKNAGEYAVPFMLDALADRTRQNEHPNIIEALPYIGRDAIRPLVAALQSDDVAIKGEIIKALGKIGYLQSLGYLKYVIEQDSSPELAQLATQSIQQIDPDTLKVPAAHLFYRLAENYYYHAESLTPMEKDAEQYNLWFWDKQKRRLVTEKVDRRYFNELMAMRSCEWALKADESLGQAIALWLAAFFKAESNGMSPGNYPAYFGQGHPDPMTYATTAGAEYLHQALARALKDEDGYVALGAVEALAATAGESSLLYRLGVAQPLVQALSFQSKPVKYSAAIAIATAGPTRDFPGSKLIIQNLAAALAEPDSAADANLANPWIAKSYAIRAAEAMLVAAQTRNRLVDLSVAQSAIIESTRDPRPRLRVLAARILAYLGTPDAQRAIAAMALDQNNPAEIRISAFDSLSASAKINGNLLDEASVDAIYALVSSQQTEPSLRAAAASAYGSLNLPSEKVKDLILDQAKS